MATIWLARVAVALYGLAVWPMFKRRRSSLARALWCAGFAVYLSHVFFAFTYFYDWSHSTALRETARQTRGLFGVDWGGGIYLNYFFTAMWAADCGWLIWAQERYRARGRAVQLVVHGILGFIVVNASLVVWVIRSLR